jgi:hypothetical protein
MRCVVARKKETLRYLFEGDIIRIPNIADVGSLKSSWMTDLLSFLVEITEKHGSERQVWDGNVYWVAQLGEHEQHVMTKWLSWHQQYEKIGTMQDLFVVPVDTGEVKA